MATSSQPATPERRSPEARIPEARSLEAPLRALARSRRAAPLVYLELTGPAIAPGAEHRDARAACKRAAAAALRDAAGSVLRRNDVVASGPGGRWFAALLVDRAVAGAARDAISDADVGIVAGRLQAAVRTRLDDAKQSEDLKESVGVRTGWTIIEPRDEEKPLGEFRHALRGAAVVARLEERRATVLAALSHELRTPLTSIVGYVEQLRDGVWTDTKKRRRALSIIAEDAARLTRLTEGLVDVGSWNAGHLALTWKPVCLRDIVTRSARAVAQPARARGVRIKVRGDANLTADPDRLTQVVVNLLDNAVRHARARGIVQVSISQPRTPGAACTVAVSDDGPGFAGVTASSLGAPFAKGAGGRVGLGLAISKTLVEAHGGDLRVGKSRRGGALIRVTIPDGHRTNPRAGLRG